MFLSWFMGCVTAVYFIFFNITDYASLYTMKLNVREEITCK